MQRREFIALIGGAVSWPLAVSAQQSGKLRTIGVLGTDAVVWRPWIAAFVNRLHQLGWIEGRTIAIEYRWSEGRADRLAEIADEFVRLKVDVVVAEGTGAAVAKRATSEIPIVLAISIDPVGSGLIASLAHPGGNITGLSNQASDLASKRLELLREVVPGLRRLAIMAHPEAPQSVIEMGKVQATAQTLGLDVIPLEIHHAGDVDTAFKALTSKSDALYVVADALVTANVARIITLALAARLPTAFSSASHVKAGGLVSYGPSYEIQFGHAADIVDKILRGAKPGDIPVEQADKFELVVNLKTAKALGLTVPESFLLRADEVIE
jgi:putative ABC transport system substrate-binding protein